MLQKPQEEDRRFVLKEGLRMGGRLSPWIFVALGLPWNLLDFWLSTLCSSKVSYFHVSIIAITGMCQLPRWNLLPAWDSESSLRHLGNGANRYVTWCDMHSRVTSRSLKVLDWWSMFWVLLQVYVLSSRHHFPYFMDTWWAHFFFEHLTKPAVTGHRHLY